MTDNICINEHSSIRIDFDGKILRFDPFRIQGAPHDADVVFITHDHYDHYSPDDIAAVSKQNTVFVFPESLARKLGGTVLHPGESAVICGIPTEAVAAYNIAKPFHPKRNGWLGYVVTLGDERVYVAGDTDATPEAEAVRCDVALVPIGGTYTMNARQARALVEKIRPSVAIPTHYGTVVGKASDADEFARGTVKAVLKL